MWVLVFFDLPTATKTERKRYAEFRKALQEDGFIMFQMSIYARHCSSKENATMHENRVKRAIPEYGTVAVITITDKQFADMQIFYGKKPKEPNAPGTQLELF